ncbi:MAG: ABC transporter permease [Acidobacteria bacterium]|nr:ABC transporter permease [Acidobacteriota bacterium]
MDRLRGLWLQCRALWRRDEAERALRDELRDHVEREVEAGVARGLSRDQAHRRALLQFGGVERFREETRDARGLNLLEESCRDLRHGWRLLARRPTFAVAVILTLALGIGANTAVFSAVYAVLLQPSPFQDPDRLVMVWETDRGSGTRHEPASWPDVVDFRDRSRTLSAIGSVAGADITLTGGGEPERVPALYVTPNLLALLGVQPLAGRLFRADEGTIGDARVVGASVAIVGEGFWRSHYRADAGIVGRTITVDGRPTTVVGVAPRSADLGIRQVHQRADYASTFIGDHVGLWLAVRPTADAFPRETHPFLTLGRLAPDATLASAQDELGAIGADLERQYQVNKNRGVNLESYGEVTFGSVRPPLVLLLGAVTLLLLVTCANVASLLLARTATRAREVALRRALGAGPGRLGRQFLAESLLLVTLGSAAGVGLAYIGLEALITLAPPDVPRLDMAALNGPVLAHAAGLAALVAFAFGLLPAFQARGLELQQMLKASGAGRLAASRGARRVRRALVVSEVAAAVMLVVGAGVLVRTLWRLQGVDPGFDASRVLKIQLQLPANRYPVLFSRFPDAPEIAGFDARLLQAVRAIPGVDSAALAVNSPLESGSTNSFAIVGREQESAGHPEIRTRALTPGYLETLAVPLLEGRNVNAGDDADAAPVVLINQAAAGRYFPDGTAVGRQIRFWGITRRIVGVIGNEKFRGVDAPTDPAVYAPMAQSPSQQLTLLLRTASADPTSAVGGVRQAVRGIDPQIALYGVEPLQAAASASIARPRLNARLMTLFALLAVLLALVGVHGVLSYMVAERAPELGLRMALGASRAAVMRSVLSDGLWLASAGVGIGLAGALAGSHLLTAFVFGVSRTDPATFIAVPLAVLATVAAASLPPALRATRVDPVKVLRAE